MKASNPIAIAMEAAYGIVDGIDGWMSETGDFPSNFWKRDVLDRYDRLGAAINRAAKKGLDPRDEMKLRKKVQDLLDDLIDGLEGVVSEQGEVPNRYWKRNALSKGKTALRALNLSGPFFLATLCHSRAPKVSSLQPLRSRRDYGENEMNEKIASELLAVARELVASNGYFKESPVYDVEDDDKIIGWGIYFDDGSKYDWVADDGNLTKSKARSIARKLDKMWNSLDDVDWKLVRRMTR